MNRSIGVALCLALCSRAFAGTQSSSPQPVLAVRVADFLNTLGISSHDNYTDGKYADYQSTITDLHYLGIHQVRDSIPDPNGGLPYLNYLEALAALQRDGETFDLVARCGSIAMQLQQVDQLIKAKPGSVIAIEGPNEVNNTPCTYNGFTDPSGFVSNTAANEFQAALYAAVKSDNNLANIPVYLYTGGLPQSYRPNSDYANTHPYPYNGQQPYDRIAGEFTIDFTDTNSFPKVITETGYYNAPSNQYGSGVDDSTQAKGILNIYLDAFIQGISKTFIYQLREAYPDQSLNNPDVAYGLFNLNNDPKPAAIAVHNLTTLLNDSGSNAATFNPGSLSYTLNGMPSTGHSLLMQKSDGSFALVLWAEPAFWDESTHSPVSVAPVPVTVQFGSPVQSVTITDPTQSTTALQVSTNTQSVTVMVTDHPVIVALNVPINGTPTPVIPSGWINIVAKHSGKCLDISDVSTAPGTAAIQYTCWCQFSYIVRIYNFG